MNKIILEFRWVWAFGLDLRARVRTDTSGVRSGAPVRTPARAKRRRASASCAYATATPRRRPPWPPCARDLRAPPANASHRSCNSPFSLLIWIIQSNHIIYHLFNSIKLYIIYRIQLNSTIFLSFIQLNYIDQIIQINSSIYHLFNWMT